MSGKLHIEGCKSCSFAASYRLPASRSMTVKTMIKRGFYDEVLSAKINDVNLPRISVGKGDEMTRAYIVRVLCYTEDFHEPRCLLTDQILVELDELGLRPGTARELLRFGMRYPEEQRKSTIVALGSTIDSEYIVAIDEDFGRRRRLGLLQRDNGTEFLILYLVGWSVRYGFLAFKKDDNPINSHLQKAIEEDCDEYKLRLRK